MTTISKALCLFGLFVFSSVLSWGDPPDSACEIKSATKLEMIGSSIKPDGRSLSILACRGEVKTLERLLKEGAKPDSPDGMGLTPLAWAARCGQREVAELLLKHGADVNAKITYELNSIFRTHQSSALMWAARGGQEDMVRFLIAKGADVKRQEMVYVQVDDGGKEKFVKAGQSLINPLTSEELIEFVLTKGASPNGEPKNTKLMEAAIDGNFKLCRLLLKFHASKNLVNEDGLSACQLAVKFHPSDANLHDLLK